MGHQHNAGPLFGELADGGHACPDAVDALEFSRCPVHRLVDVHPAQDGLAFHIKVIECLYPESHLFLCEIRISEGP